MGCCCRLPGGPSDTRTGVFFHRFAKVIFPEACVKSQIFHFQTARRSGDIRDRLVYRYRRQSHVWHLISTAVSFLDESERRLFIGTPSAPPSQPPMTCFMSNNDLRGACQAYKSGLQDRVLNTVSSGGSKGGTSLLWLKGPSTERSGSQCEVLD